MWKRGTSKKRLPTQGGDGVFSLFPFLLTSNLPKWRWIFFSFLFISFDFYPFKVEKDIAQGVRVGTIGNDLEEEPMTQVGKFKKIKEKKAARVVAF